MSVFKDDGRSVGQQEARRSESFGTPGKQTLTERLEVPARESRHGAPSEGAQQEAMTGAVSAVTLQVQTTLPGKGQGAGETREGGAAHAAAPQEAVGHEMPATASWRPAAHPRSGLKPTIAVAEHRVGGGRVDGRRRRGELESRCDLADAGRSIRINPWPSNPTSMTIPNTPNPVVGGNINNTAGSDNHWQAAINDMADYDTAGGGAGPNWHSTAASTAHEWAHWNKDYVGDAVTSAAGGNWAAVDAPLVGRRRRGAMPVEGCATAGCIVVGHVVDCSLPVVVRARGVVDISTDHRIRVYSARSST